MRILMVGAGATGGYFGGRLAQAGRDVTFLVRGVRMRQLQSGGLRIVSPHGDAVMQPRVVDAATLQKEKPYDLIVVSTKAYSLDAAMEDFAPAAGPGTIVLPVLNGMRQLDVLSERFGTESVMGGSVRIIADMDADGRIQQMTPLSELNFGELSKVRTSRSERLLEAFSVPGIKAKLADDIHAALWQKWWFLSSIGALCMIGRGTIGDIASSPYGSELALHVIHEATSVAAANGYPANPAMLEEQCMRMTEAGSTLTSSMYRDMLKGMPVEADHILGDLIARSHDVETLLLKAAYLQLKVYEAHREGIS